MANNQNKSYLSPREAAKLLMVSPITVRAWAQKGLLPSETTLGGHRRFLRESVEQFAKQSKAIPERSDLRVLIVDDDKQVAGFLVEWLSGLDEPFIVSSAADGFEAGSKVYTFEPDIILLDLMMPKLDGFAVCQQIKADPDTRDIRVIAMTGYPSLENEQRILEAGAEICISKPLDTKFLLGLLKAEL
ncbi:response regulator [Candidatus Methylobacter oryzae]|uniref:Response regulator n=1 Tax=Candidatus Methylobacter oryzae TaxID=2497749 RepID=A0ABY3CG15_9GAMM|nr:response regulator [Candidatus Methylobacter oryzae]TRX02639.1 response regulator [Candidatus Methylobacter oryzae]